MDPNTRRHFFHHGGQDKSVHANSAEVKNCHLCQLRSFESGPKYPISVVNDTNDGVGLAPGFRFIPGNVLKDGVSHAEASFRSGCDCVKGRDCMYDGCHCLEELLDSDEEDSSSSESEYYGGGGNARSRSRGGGKRKKKFAYYSKGEKAGLLRTSHLQSRKPIYECHDGCHCGPDCPNRVVERGRTVPLQIFRTDDGRGWGVRSTIDIKKGQFVDTYVGEVITSREADRRRNASGQAKHKDVYLFGLDKFSDEDSLDPRLSGPPLEVDGEYMSGPSRFVNHSCDPSMRIFARVGDHADKHLHDLALFAVREIPKGEELTFDYVDGGVEELNSSQIDDDPELQKGMTKCLCRSDNCRKYLW